MSRNKIRFSRSKMLITAFITAVSCLFLTTNSRADTGEELFRSNCASCHNLSSQKMTGPGLAGITDKRSEEWLQSWISNSTELIASGDQDAIDIFEEYDKMTMLSFTQFSEEEIGSIIDYLAEAAPAGGGDVATNDAVAGGTGESETIPMSEGEKSFAWWSVLIAVLILFFFFRYLSKVYKKLEEGGVDVDKKNPKHYPQIFVGILILMVGIFYLLSYSLQNDVGQLNNLMFSVFPYVAFGIFIVGSIYRYTKKGYQVSSLSSQFIEGKKLFWGSQPFHWGLLIIFFGHLIAFLFPSTLIAFNGQPVRLLILEISSFAFGLAALLGLILLIKRRLTSSSLLVVSNKMDMVVYVILLIQIISGLGVAFFVRWGSTWFASVLTPYLRSVFSFNPDIGSISTAPVLVQLHVISAFLIIAIIPFTRFMHFLVAPVDYLWRKYQLVVWNWDKSKIRSSTRHTFGKKTKNH